MTRLAAALRDPDLSDPELQAMRLDGELYRVAAVWASVDEPATPALRARAVLGERSPRLVAELRTAAWIWGAVPELPRPVELCSDVRARARVRPGVDAVVREVLFEPGDVTTVGGVAVTTPARTIADLARGGLVDDDVLRGLAIAGDVGSETVLEALSRRSLTGRRLAIETVERALRRC